MAEVDGGLQWHFQLAAGTLRLLPPGGFERGVRYEAIAQVLLLGLGWAYVHSMLRTDGHPLARGDFGELLRKLQVDHGIEVLMMVRRKRMKLWDLKQGKPIRLS